MKLIVALLIILPAAHAQAWGRRGHVLVCETAALLIKDEDPLLPSYAFDLAYYCNVPDLIWKKGDLDKQEWFNHFMDLEIFDRALRGSSVPHPFDLSRQDFDRNFPRIRNDAGRAWWRIRELNVRLDEAAKKLRGIRTEADEHHSLQSEWFVVAGAIGHYVGDLAQPLHVTENFDGQHTHQKGVHSFFENRIVDELYSRGDLASEIFKRALKRWKEEKKSLGEKSVDDIIRTLSEDSMKELPELLRLDHEVGREDIKKSADRFHSLVVERLSAGAVATAELWRRQLGWKFDSYLFTHFEATPAYIPPPTASPKTP